MPTFSPDSAEVAFHVREFGPEGGTIRRIRVDGGTPFDICRARAVFWAGMDWGPKENLVFSRAGDGLARVSAGGGEPESITSVEIEKGERFHIEPHFLPDSESVLFTVVFDDGTTATEEVSLTTGERARLSHVGGFARFVASGHLIYPRKGALLVSQFDPREN